MENDFLKNLSQSQVRMRMMIIRMVEVMMMVMMVIRMMVMMVMEKDTFEN